MISISKRKSWFWHWYVHRRLNTLREYNPYLLSIVCKHHRPSLNFRRKQLTNNCTEYTIRWGWHGRFEDYEKYNSSDPELKDKNIDDIVICKMNEIIDFADWCDVYKDGKLVNHYDVIDEFR